MKKILAIGGAVIKTAKEELRQAIEEDRIEMLIHNGGSVFHDFQQVLDPNLKGHSYPLENLLKSYECNREPAEHLWGWLHGIRPSPSGSITALCEKKKIPVLMFTASGCDFWHLFGDHDDWAHLGKLAMQHISILRLRIIEGPFHYVCMGSAVIHPEIFSKAITGTNLDNIRADVVDFKEMYRPRTRVAKFGYYFCMTHKEYFDRVLLKEKG